MLASVSHIVVDLVQLFAKSVETSFDDIENFALLVVSEALQKDPEHYLYALS